jgi:hypothetical protein
MGIAAEMAPKGFHEPSIVPENFGLAPTYRE